MFYLFSVLIAWLCIDSPLRWNVAARSLKNKRGELEVVYTLQRRLRVTVLVDVDLELKFDGGCGHCGGSVNTMLSSIASRSSPVAVTLGCENMYSRPLPKSFGMGSLSIQPRLIFVW